MMSSKERMGAGKRRQRVRPCPLQRAQWWLACPPVSQSTSPFQIRQPAPRHRRHASCRHRAGWRRSLATPTDVTARPCPSHRLRRRRCCPPHLQSTHASLLRMLRSSLFDPQPVHPGSGGRVPRVRCPGCWVLSVSDTVPDWNWKAYAFLACFLAELCTR